ncbi:MAG: crotonase [Bacteroidetes bacterium CG23_combo_of_CG06-09_8_20_14_all_32_9]|nr:MAG: crotonase [Bacteroidetes bacterium CG23_combo_of_CG06-09_8_20_14_all_32_9]
MDYKILKFEVANNIALVTINRPQAMNALNSDFFKEMNEMLTYIASQKEIRALIITGEGKAFVAGADIAEMSGMNSEQGKQFSKTGQNVFNCLGTLEIPVIAAVNGFALGGGCELAMACDIRIASTFAKFGQPEVNLGLIPGYAGTQRLPRLVGLSNALYLLMTADIINAEEAYRIGLVQKVVEPSQLIAEAMNVANKIASKGKIAIKKVKEVAIKGSMFDFNSACDLEANEFGNLFGNGESGEGMNAFLEKRKPQW